MSKGFTLVELLAVIIILGVLTLITVVSINPILNDAKKSLTDSQINNIEESASLYYIKYGVGLDDFELNNPKDCINVSKLIESGYINSEEITNPKTGEPVLGSVKVTYKSNNYIYEYQDTTCTNYDKGIICERVKSTDVGNVPEGKFVAGDAYNCKVDPNKEPYKFYVLTTPEEDSDKVNLIMDRNICEDGTPATESNKCTVAYNSSGDVSRVGPVTAMDYLNQATSTWENIDNLNLIYDDEGANFTGVTLNGKARLPYKSEVTDFNNNGYLFENLYSCNWDFDQSTKPINNISEIYGYWTLSSSLNTDDIETAWYVYSNGRVNDSWSEVDCDDSIRFATVGAGNIFGVRPVISMYKFQME